MRVHVVTFTKNVSLADAFVAQMAVFQALVDWIMNSLAKFDLIISSR